MTLKISRLAVITCIACCVQAWPVFACRYNVREIGFVDLGIEPYYFCAYVNQDTPADVNSSFEQILNAALMDTNVEFEIVNVDQQKEHPATKHLDSKQIRTFPSAILVSPDGQTLAVSVSKPGEPFEQTLRSALDDMLLSPKRKEILQQAAKAYGVVLVIDGPDAEENKKAKQAASAVIKQVGEQMQWMPKSIAHPPVVVEVDSESLSREKVLLWSLGLDPDNIDQPHAAVLYGRARWIGPMFVGEEITEDNLAAVLFVIGADCECGFDHRWLQGTMLPARWDEKLQAQAVESLGFDPENPMIKAEISWIVRRGYPVYPSLPLGYQELVVESEPNDQVQRTGPPIDQNTVPLGYQELVVELESNDQAQQMASVADQNAAPPTPAVARPGPEKPALAEGSGSHEAPLPVRRASSDEPRATSHAFEPLWQKPLYFIAGLAILVVATGLFIVFRAARKNL